jgi:hypothetical protein
VQLGQQLAQQGQGMDQAGQMQGQQEMNPEDMQKLLQEMGDTFNQA